MELILHDPQGRATPANEIPGAAAVGESRFARRRSAADNGRVQASAALHLDLDGAWTPGTAGLPTLDLRFWGPPLRFCALRGQMEQFRAVCEEQLGEARFLVYGSGDFHHLSALWLARVKEPVTLVSFDNHPDWDIRPPMWCCGSWINRALDLAHVERIAVWGCGNFECWGWHRMWGNHSDVRSGRLAVHAWADERSAADQARPHAITRPNWRERFGAFVEGLKGREVYVTVDLDCLREGEAVTNWENGRFTAEDVCWALEELRRGGAAIIAGDVCGAYSPKAYARWKQAFASETDHPEMPAPDPAETRRINAAALEAIWPRLCGKG
jgi:arginase family enzyme